MYIYYRYVKREEHEILAHVLIPKDSHSEPRPVIVNWHGGYLVGGHGLYPPIFPQFIINLALKHSAVIISPDYTLLPHQDGLAAIQDDILAFHSWLNCQLPELLEKRVPGAFIDVSRLLVHGASAGGYVALAHALAEPAAIGALSLSYPMIDFDTDWWKKGIKAVNAPNPFHYPDEAFPANDDDVKARIETYRNGPRESVTGIDRVAVGMWIARIGLFHDVFNPNGRLDENELVWLNRRVKTGARLPERIWVLHGSGDTAVPPDTSTLFAAVMEAQGRKVRLDMVDGKEHGFDMAASENWQGANDPLILEATAWLAETWLN